MVYSFTKEEKEKINSRLDAVLNEFITMVREANIGERDIDIPIGFNADYDSIGYPTHPHFYISEETIALLIRGGVSYYEPLTYLYNDDKVRHPQTDLLYNADCLFLSEYEFIKKRLSDILTSYKDNKSSLLKRALDSHSDAFDDVEISFPKISSKHVIEVTLEDGKTVGTIDFGDRTIRIITDGDIVLVNSPSKDREKAKVLGGEC